MGDSPVIWFTIRGLWMLWGGEYLTVTPHCKREEVAFFTGSLEYAVNLLILLPYVWQILRMPFVTVATGVSGSGHWSAIVRSE